MSKNELISHINNWWFSEDGRKLFDEAKKTGMISKDDNKQWSLSKKKEQVNISGPHAVPKLDKKKKKKIAQVPNRFESIKSFAFADYGKNWESLLGERTTAFTHSSSFVGQVIYDSETQDMKITLGGESYVFCNVPDRVFDSFEGASSKGKFFNNQIKGQFDC